MSLGFFHPLLVFLSEEKELILKVQSKMHWAMLLAVSGATTLQMHESNSLGSVLLLIEK